MFSIDFYLVINIKSKFQSFSEMWDILHASLTLPLHIHSPNTVATTYGSQLQYLLKLKNSVHNRKLWYANESVILAAIYNTENSEKIDITKFAVMQYTVPQCDVTVFWGYLCKWTWEMDELNWMKTIVEQNDKEKNQVYQDD